MSHYTHLSIEERESLLLNIGAGKTLREIARILQRSASTLSRELKRNCENREEYSPDKAARNYRKRRKKCCRQRILKDAAAKALIEEADRFAALAIDKLNTKRRSFRFGNSV